MNDCNTTILNMRRAGVLAAMHRQRQQEQARDEPMESSNAESWNSPCDAPQVDYTMSPQDESNPLDYDPAVPVQAIRSAVAAAPSSDAALSTLTPAAPIYVPTAVVALTALSPSTIARHSALPAPSTPPTPPRPPTPAGPENDPAEHNVSCAYTPSGDTTLSDDEFTDASSAEAEEAAEYLSNEGNTIPDGAPSAAADNEQEL